MKELLMIFILILLLSLNCVLNKVQYSESFIAFYEDPVDEQNFNLLKEYGYVLDTQINIGTGFYKFVRKEGRKRIATNTTNDQEELQRKDPKLLSFEQERLWFREKKSNIKYRDTSVKERSKRAVTISDSSWSKQWHLAPSHIPSMGVYNVWDSGYTGKGVTVAIVDDGIETSHSDLAANYKASLSIDIIHNISDPSHVYSTDGHGTNCAGVVAAVKNTKCVIGTAYEASIPAIRLLDEVFGATDSEEASALVHQLANIDIYSNSWGPSDNGMNFDSALSSVQQAALVQGVTNATTNRNDTCIVGFQGTSAATPVASGIIALVLQANPNLTWRDVQHMIVEYSIKTGLKNANFYTNGAGKKVSLSHGFGLMNAERMVNSASSWQTVPSRIFCEGSTSSLTTSKNGIGNISETYSVGGCNIKYVEHLLVKISFKSLYREYTSIYLVSPNGTNSRLLRERCEDSGTSSVTWTFMSVHTWGENPTGTWTLRMQSSDSKNKMYLYSWKLDLHGTETNPIPNTPADGSLGGYCDGSTPCISSTHLCNLTTHRCVSCDTGYHAINGVCVQDGAIGGFCDITTYCNNTAYRCENNICTARTDEESTSSSNNNIGVIVGAVVGGVAGVGVVVGVVIIAIKSGIITTSTVAPAPAMIGTTAQAPHPSQTGSIHHVFDPVRYQ